VCEECSTADVVIIEDVFTTPICRVSMCNTPVPVLVNHAIVRVYVEPFVGVLAMSRLALGEIQPYLPEELQEIVLEYLSAPLFLKLHNVPNQQAFVEEERDHLMSPDCAFYIPEVCEDSTDHTPEVRRVGEALKPGPCDKCGFTKCMCARIRVLEGYIADCELELTKPNKNKKERKKLQQRIAGYNRELQSYTQLDDKYPDEETTPEVSKLPASDGTCFPSGGSLEIKCPIDLDVSFPLDESKDLPPLEQKQQQADVHEPIVEIPQPPPPMSASDISEYLKAIDINGKYVQSMELNKLKRRNNTTDFDFENPKTFEEGNLKWRMHGPVRVYIPLVTNVAVSLLDMLQRGEIKDLVRVSIKMTAAVAETWAMTRRNPL